MAADPHDPRPSGLIRFRVAGTWRGHPIELERDIDIRKLDATILYLQQQGLALPADRPEARESRT